MVRTWNVNVRHIVWAFFNSKNERTTFPNVVLSMCSFIISIKHWGFIGTCHCRKVQCIIVHLCGLWFATVPVWHHMHTCDICVWRRSRIPRQLVCVRLLVARLISLWLSVARLIGSTASDLVSLWADRLWGACNWVPKRRTAPPKQHVNWSSEVYQVSTFYYVKLIGERLVKFFLRRLLFLKSVHFTRVEPYARRIYGHITMCLSLKGEVQKTCFGF